MSGIAESALKSSVGMAVPEDDYGINAAWLETSNQIERFAAVITTLESKLDSYVSQPLDKPAVGNPSSSKGHSAMGRRNWDTADSLRVQVNRLESLLYSLDV